MKRIDDVELKKILLSILDEVDLFCKKNDINYYLIAGTLLGAVRHKGFIPWDDDIDICMKRSDYEKFISCYSGITTRLLNHRNSENYYYPFSKIEKIGTLSLENGSYAEKVGINIDVFPIDNVPDHESERKKFFKKIKKYRRIIGRKVLYKNFDFYRKIFYWPYLFISKNKICKYIDKLNTFSMRYNNVEGRYCCEVIWGIGDLETVPRLIFDDKISLQFENNYYYAPVMYDKWLSIRYGDYMKLPPENKRVNPHVREDYIISDKEEK